MLGSLDAKGVIDPDTGLLANAVFWRHLNRAMDEAEKRGASLSIAQSWRVALPVCSRIAMLTADGKRGGVDAAVTFATLKPSDNIESLVARVAEEPPKPA